jgi:hypothetical protein
MVSGAEFQGKTTAEGVVSVISVTQSQWESGDGIAFADTDGFYTEGSARHLQVSNPGAVKYQQSKTLDASISNQYRSTTYTEFESGGIFGESGAIADFTPNVSPELCDGNLGITDSTYIAGYPEHQWADAESQFLGTAATIESALTINDADLALSTIAAWDGTALYTDRFMGDAESGADHNTTEINYRGEVTSHNVFSSNDTGGARVKTEWVWSDFSDVFVTNSTKTNITQNQTINLTEV